MHADAHLDSLPLSLPGIDPRILDVRILTPLDFAVSRLGRFSQDREVIAALARRRLIDAKSLGSRATEALSGTRGYDEAPRQHCEREENRRGELAEMTTRPHGEWSG